jgi:DnaD/phage-associated family protein
MDESIQVKGKRNLPIQIDRALIEVDGKQIGVYGLAVYAVLCLYENLPVIAPSISTIGDYLGISRNTVKEAITKLEAAGWLAVERRFDPQTKVNNTSVYHLLNRPEGVGRQMTEGRSPQGHNTTTATTGDGNEPLPITAVWEQEAKAMLSPILGQELFDLEDTYSYAWVVDAIKEAVITQGVGKFNVKYVATILKRWAAEGREKVKPVEPADNGLFESWRTVY